MNKDNKNDKYIESAQIKNSKESEDSYSSACVLDVSSFFLYGSERITNKERTGGC